MRENSSFQEPDAVKAVLDWNPPVADQGLTPSTLVTSANGKVNPTLGTWSLATWSRANGALRAGFAASSCICKSCSATASSGGELDASAPGTWHLEHGAAGLSHPEALKGWWGMNEGRWRVRIPAAGLSALLQ